MCSAGTSVQTLELTKNHQDIPPDTGASSTLAYPDNAAGNQGLCQSLASQKAMPNDSSMPAQSNAQSRPIGTYLTEPASPIYHGLSNITNPVLLFSGTEDEIISVEDVYTLERNIPGASFVQFANAGHASIKQYGVISGQIISAYLDYTASNPQYPYPDDHLV